jgi:hypothetical protein
MNYQPILIKAFRDAMAALTKQEEEELMQIREQDFHSWMQAQDDDERNTESDE